MKIAIMSDFHLGFNDDALTQAAEALRKARGIADFVIAAGDLFDIRVPRQETVDDAVRIFNQHKRESDKAGLRIFELDGNKEKELETVPLVGIYGTHERRTKGLVNIIQIMDSAAVMLNAHAKVIVVEKNGERVAIQAMGGVPEDQAAEDLNLLDQKPVPGLYNIFMFHQTVTDIIGVGEGITVENLPAGFDLYVDGHIHWAHDLNIRGKRLLLPGSTVVTQMKVNEMEPKGLFLLDTKTGDASFVKINSRPFLFSEIVFDRASPSKIEEEVSKKLAELVIQAAGRMPLVKLKLQGTLEKGLQVSNIDLSRVEKDFREKMFLSVDKEFSTEELKSKIELVRRLREEKKSLREMGLSVLKKKLAEAGVKLPAEDLFELLSEAKGSDKDEKIKKAIELA